MGSVEEELLITISLNEEITLNGEKLDATQSIALNYALEKQIARRPAKRVIGRLDGHGLKRVYSDCPFCNKQITDIIYKENVIDHARGIMSKYCMECGQKLDWTKED